MRSTAHLYRTLYVGSAFALGGALAFATYPVFFATPAPEPHTSATMAAIPLQPATTTPQHILAGLTIEDAIPPQGKFIAADLSDMKLYLYKDGAVEAHYDILTKGRPGSPYETPSGFYAVLTKQRDHINWGEGVHMPYSMQFYGNYFIHGWPYYLDGRPVSRDYSGGCIRLSTEDAAEVFAFSDPKTPLFVYEAAATTSSFALQLGYRPAPRTSAASYLVADVDTGHVYLEREAAARYPISPISKLMTALVASETIMYDRQIGISETVFSSTTEGIVSLRVGDLLYPLLMRDSNAVAERLASYYGTEGFVRWMNSTAPSLNMRDTHFADPSGMSEENISTAEDLYRLARYIARKKLFIFTISRTPEKTLKSPGGSLLTVENNNSFAGTEHFLGGSIGVSTAGETALSVFIYPAEDTDRRIAFVVLGSQDAEDDTKKLYEWFTAAAIAGAKSPQSACAACALPVEYRKIEL